MMAIRPPMQLHIPLFDGPGKIGLHFLDQFAIGIDLDEDRILLALKIFFPG